MLFIKNVFLLSLNVFLVPILKAFTKNLRVFSFIFQISFRLNVSNENFNTKVLEVAKA